LRVVDILLARHDVAVDTLTEVSVVAGVTPWTSGCQCSQRLVVAVWRKRHTLLCKARAFGHDNAAGPGTVD
jgi:hypothetical protein